MSICGTCRPILQWVKSWIVSESLSWISERSERTPGRRTLLRTAVSYSYICRGRNSQVYDMTTTRTRKPPTSSYDDYRVVGKIVQAGIVSYLWPPRADLDRLAGWRWPQQYFVGLWSGPTTHWQQLISAVAPITCTCCGLHVNQRTSKTGWLHYTSGKRSLAAGAVLSNPTSFKSQTRRYTTLWNINVRKPAKFK